MINPRDARPGCSQGPGLAFCFGRYNGRVSRSQSAPLRVCSFESRRRDEMQQLLRRSGAVPTVVPSMQEVPLEHNSAVFEFAGQLLSGQIDVVIFLTGVGARALLEIVCQRHGRESIIAALARCCVVVRGPKPVAVLREWGVRIDLRAPEPNTWRELLQVLDADGVPLSGRSVAVQEYGRSNEELYRELTRRRARVRPVPVYRWALPDDIAPLEDAVRRTLAGEFDVLMFTSAFQATSVLRVAERLGVRAEWLAAANRCLIASIGPTASETLREEGLVPDLEPTHPKMGHLVNETCTAGASLLAAKVARGQSG